MLVHFKRSLTALDNTIRKKNQIKNCIVNNFLETYLVMIGGRHSKKRMIKLVNGIMRKAEIFKKKKKCYCLICLE